MLGAGTGRWRLWLSIMCFGLAVAARADALLIIPCLLWRASCRMPFLQLIRSEKFLLGGGTLLLALCLGIVVAKGDLGEEVATYFNPKVFLAYVVFGLGAATIVIAWIASGIGAAVGCRPRRHRSFYAAGLVAFGLTPAFYALRLFSTRYWTVWTVGMIVLLSSRRTAVLLHSKSKWVEAGLAFGCLLGAYVPLVIGLNLPFRDSPNAVISAGTRFPTADGNLSMGGYLFALRDVSRSNGLVDHNQAIWLAARDAGYRPNSADVVLVVDSPMVSYIELAVTLRGYRISTLSSPEEGACIDSRSLIRPAMNFATGRQSMPLMESISAVPISAEFFGATILLFVKDAPKNGYGREILFLRDVFAGNEFRRVSSDTDGPVGKFEGSTRVWYSHNPFSLETRLPSGDRQVFRSALKDGYDFVRLNGHELRFRSVSIQEQSDAADVREAVSVLPDYMDIGSYAASRR